MLQSQTLKQFGFYFAGVLKHPRSRDGCRSSSFFDFFGKKFCLIGRPPMASGHLDLTVRFSDFPDRRAECHREGAAEGWGG